MSSPLKDNHSICETLEACSISPTTLLQSPNVCDNTSSELKTAASLRPSLKRQSTAPMQTHCHSTKKSRGPPEDDQKNWSEDIHDAFLEALETIPLISTWRTGHPDSQVEEDHFKVIQDYISRKTGRLQPIEYIERKLSISRYSQSNGPVIKPHISSIPTAIATHLSTSTAQHSFESGPSTYLSQLRGSPIPCIGNPSLHERSNASGPYISDTPSMTRRRQANNRPMLSLHVDIPSFKDSLLSTSRSSKDTLTPGSVSASGTPSSLASLVTGFPQNSSNPVTPLDQCSKGPPTLPEAPRMIDIRRNKPGRWAPTPTEGVLPTFPYVATDSPASPHCDGVKNNSKPVPKIGMDGFPPRPGVPHRSGSWLSYPKTIEVEGRNDGLAALASPFCTSYSATPVHSVNSINPETQQYSEITPCVRVI